MQDRASTVDTIMKDMAPIDPTRQLNRYHAQLERETATIDITVNNELSNFIESRL